MAETDVQAQEQFETFLREAMRAPVPHLFHDSSAHRDEALRRLVRDGGMRAYGLYWLLVELLTGAPEHSYYVGDDFGWEMLAQDMSRLEPMSVEECQSFVGLLRKYELISAEHYDELSRVLITRIMADVRRYAEGTAKKKLGAWKRHSGSAGQ